MQLHQKLNIKGLLDDEEKKTLKRAEGIGTVATRDSIIELLIKRGYIERKDNKLISTQLGRTLIQMMPDDYLLTNVHATAYLESLLSEVEACKMTKEDFYMELRSFINKTCSDIKNNIKTINVEREVIATCKQCGKLILENSKAYSFCLKTTWRNWGRKKSRQRKRPNYSMKLKSSKGKAWSQSMVYSFENKRVEFAEQR